MACHSPPARLAKVLYPPLRVSLWRHAPLPETPLDVEADVQVVLGQRRALVGRGDVLVGVGGVVVRQEDLEVVAADGALEAEGPAEVGFHTAGEVVVLRDE